MVTVSVAMVIATVVIVTCDSCAIVCGWHLKLLEPLSRLLRESGGTSELRGGSRETDQDFTRSVMIVWSEF